MRQMVGIGKPVCNSSGLELCIFSAAHRVEWDGMYLEVSFLLLPLKAVYLHQGNIGLSFAPFFKITCGGVF